MKIVAVRNCYYWVIMSYVFFHNGVNSFSYIHPRKKKKKKKLFLVVDGIKSVGIDLIVLFPLPLLMICLQINNDLNPI